MKKVEVYCRVLKGILALDRTGLDRQIKSLKDGQYQMTIEPVPNNISHQQRKYFFGVVVKELILGFANKGIAVTFDETRTLLEELFIYREEYNPVLDTTLKARISFANTPKGITKDEFDKIVTPIQHHAITEWGINIPDPNEIDYSTK